MLDESTISEVDRLRYYTSLMWYPNIWIKESKGKGNGVFALADIPEDTLICEYIGNIMTK